MHEEEKRVIKPISLGGKVQTLHVWLAMLVEGYTHGWYEKFQHTHVRFKGFHTEWTHWVQLVLLRLTDVLGLYDNRDKRETASLPRLVIQLALLWQMIHPVISSTALTHLGDWLALTLPLKAILWGWRLLMCVHKGLGVCVGELTWPSGSRCSSLWCTDRSVCRPGRSLWRLCEYPAGIWGHRLSLGTGTHRGRRMEKQCYSRSALRMTMHSSCWQTQHTSTGLQSLFHT